MENALEAFANGKLAYFFGYSGGDLFFASADYGTAFLVAAGMLNVLSMFDAFDIALGRKN